MTHPNPETITVELGWPHKSLSPNSRTDRRSATKHRQAARLEGFAQVRKAIGVKRLKAPVRVSMAFYPPDNRRRDLDNMIGATKAHRDGISDAIKIDDSKWELSFSKGDPVDGGKVITTIEEVR